jgi:hypothetical protein
MDVIMFSELERTREAVIMAYYKCVSVISLQDSGKPQKNSG